MRHTYLLGCLVAGCLVAGCTRPDHAGSRRRRRQRGAGPQGRRRQPGRSRARGGGHRPAFPHRAGGRSRGRRPEPDGTDRRDRPQGAALCRGPPQGERDHNDAGDRVRAAPEARDAEGRGRGRQPRRPAEGVAGPRLCRGQLRAAARRGRGAAGAVRSREGPRLHLRVPGPERAALRSAREGAAGPGRPAPRAARRSRRRRGCRPRRGCGRSPRSAASRRSPTPGRIRRSSARRGAAARHARQLPGLPVIVSAFDKAALEELRGWLTAAKATVGRVDAVLLSITAVVPGERLDELAGLDTVLYVELSRPGGVGRLRHGGHGRGLHPARRLRHALLRSAGDAGDPRHRLHGGRRRGDDAPGPQQVRLRPQLHQRRGRGVERPARPRHPCSRDHLRHGDGAGAPRRRHRSGRLGATRIRAAKIWNSGGRARRRN